MISYQQVSSIADMGVSVAPRGSLWLSSKEIPPGIEHVCVYTIERDSGESGQQKRLGGEQKKLWTTRTAGEAPSS